jgi:hypothetical protein
MGGPRAYTAPLAVPASTANPVIRRRVELAIRVLSPVLDLTLAIGERLSRVLEREDPDYLPARMDTAGERAPRGLHRRPGARSS